MFTHIGTSKLTKPGYSFNNIIHTDGFNCSIEFVRNDQVGKVFKADSAEFKIQEIYINDVDPQDILGSKIVACDPGKRDLLYFTALKNNHSRDQASSFKTDYDSHRLTQMEWNRVSRIHEHQMYLARCQRHGTEFNNTPTRETIQQLDTILDDFNSNSAFFDEFKEYVIAKLEIDALTKDFYSARLWRIQKMQRYVHRQKTEARLLNNLVSKFGNPENFIIIMGDFGMNGKANLRHQRPTRGTGWYKFSRRFNFDLLLVDEAFTSSKCPLCESDVKNFLTVSNPRPYKRIKYPTTTCWGLLGCESDVCRADVRPVDPVEVDPNRPRHYYLRRFWKRNRLACLNMLNIVDSCMNGQERPVYLSN
ncbi:hypothetical protein RCL1_007683 [Eukaryota sp. TZLM3-RCL]